MFSTTDYLALHRLVFRTDYPGYKPTVVEIPNGDGKADAEKRYAHVATKYFATEEQRRDLMPYLEYAHGLAMKVARKIGLPKEYRPRIKYGALRVLDYLPGSVSNKHEDFDLFTLMMYRDQPNRFRSERVKDLQAVETLKCMHEINPQAHIGQLGTEVGLGRATPHEVLPSSRTQRSIVYFSIPDHDAVLPNGVVVRDWLNARMVRSRTEFKEYEKS